MGLTVSNAKWPEFLATPSAIAEYVSDLSPYDICCEQIEEMYHGCRGRLTWTDISNIRLGPNENNTPSRKRQKACDAKPVETMPPLLVDDGVVMDGSHRYRSLMAKGVTHCWAYHIEEIPSPSIGKKKGCESSPEP